MPEQVITLARFFERLARAGLCVESNFAAMVENS